MSSSASSDNPIITINAATTINKKLTPSTFPQWRAQFEALFIGYELMDFVTGNLQCPAIDAQQFATSKAANSQWIRQDKLILHALLASTSTMITPLLASCKTSHEAWTKLTRLYAGKSRTRVMRLKEDLTLNNRGNRTVTEFIQAIKLIADELSIIDHPVSDDDLTLYILNGLGPEYREIAAPIRARENSLKFEELHDLLVGHESYLCRMDQHATHSLVATANFSQRKGGSSGSTAQHPFSNKGRDNAKRSNNGSGFRKYKPKCQLCDQLGHIAKSCPKHAPNDFSANCAASSKSKDQKCLVDSAASHNMTTDLSNLSIHSEYDGTDEVVIGDGSCLPVSHIGSLSFASPNCIFHLRDTLCVPTIKKNLISVHHFTKQNNVFLEFHPSHFFVKDRITGATLLKDECEDGVYPLPETMATVSKPAIAYVHERTAADGWHKRLGHPSSKIVQHLIRTFSLPINKNGHSSLCVSCSQNKAHRQMFQSHGLNSTAPLQLIYTDVWGPSHDIEIPKFDKPTLDKAQSVVFSLPTPSHEPSPMPHVSTLGITDPPLPLVDSPPTSTPSQHKYIRDLLARTSMDGAKDVTTPLSTSVSLKLDDGSAVVDSTEYRRTATKRLLRYLKNTIFYGITINKTISPSLTCYSDADCAGNLDNRSSTSAYLIMLGSNPISRSSKKQRAIARSSTEAEYRALAIAAFESMWILSLFSEMKFSLPKPPMLLCDNLGVTHLSFNPVQHSRMKHIQIDSHFVWDLVQKNALNVRHVHTNDQLADLLTKPLSRQRTDYLRNKIGLTDGSLFLRGRIKEESNAINMPTHS
ncbi:hypothetical protein HHK36_030674 [Tetracentron sinense]|uniref:CCHC-type domain-containing protein n=1 Tax=Tetracentron sinense TaxID=13715 RepID=A0A834YA00_TETSI|nr:hypothetical protein HHK36_030674 [Tetracentron sinense]